MSLSMHHRLAMVGATAASAIALNDAMTHGLTGEASVFGDETGPVWAQVVSYGVHGLAYVALAAVLVVERLRVDEVSRVARVARHATVAALAALAVVFLVATPLVRMLETEAVEGWVGGVAGFGFLGMFLGGFALGVALWRRPLFQFESRLLAGLPVALGLIILLAALAPGFAHPAYLEVPLHYGIALIGAGAQVRQGRRVVLTGQTL
jgi:hypothetical protein